MKDRMPALPETAMNDAQKKAAAELIAGPRKGVFGPFIPLMRSPDLMDRLQRVGEYLRTELLAHRGVSDATYARVLEQFGEGGVIDLVGVVGYFATLCMVMNVAHTPSPAGEALAALPL